MRSTWLLAKRGLKQAPFQAVATVILSALCAALIGIGVLNSVQFPAAFEDRLDELHTADLVVGMSDPAFVDRTEEVLLADERVEGVEREPLLGFTTSIDRAGSASGGSGEAESVNANIYLFDFEAPSAARSTVIRDTSPEVFDDGVYVARQLFDSYGYRLGDRIELSTPGGGSLAFTVQGFFERPFFGSNSFGMLGIAFSAEHYERLLEAHPELPERTMLPVMLRDTDDADAVISAAQTELGHDPAFDPATFNSFDRGLYTSVSTMPAMITAMLLIAFVVIITAAVAVIIAYLCGQRLRRDLSSIGILKALGFSGARIRAALIAMFLGLSFAGVALGTAITYLIAPVLARDYSARAGSVWQPQFSLLALGIAVIVVTVPIALATLIGTRRAVRYAPVEALRGTVGVHSFTRNPFPLDRSRGPITWLLALKTAGHNSAQLIGVVLVVALFSFASVFATVMMNSATNHQRLFKDAISGGISNVMLSLDTSDDGERDALIDRIAAHDGVEVVVPAVEIDLSGPDSSKMYTSVVSDPALVRYNPLVEGRLPVHENEVAVGVRYAKVASIRPGDEVEFALAGETRSLLVTGLIQGTRSLGMIGLMTEDALQGFDDEAHITDIAIFTEEGVDAAALIRDLERDLGDRIGKVSNVDAEVGPEAKTFIDLVVVFAQSVLAITVLVVALMLWLMVSTLLGERRRDFGVQRALGYTWPRLAAQLTLSYLPLIALGVTLGAILGAVCFNPLLGAMLGDLGLSHPAFPVVPWQVALIAGGLILVASALLTALSAGIQRISPSELIRE